MLYLTTPIQLLDVKADGSAMQFTAYASTFGNVDHGGDVIEKGAFKSTIQNPNRDRPLLWQHDPRSPIGIEKAIREDTKGLLGTWEIVDTQQGLDAYKLLKQGAVRSMSIGYIPKTWEWQKEGEVRVLKEIDLLENSVVSIPMNDQARIQTVKAMATDEIEQIIAATIAAMSGQPAGDPPKTAVDISLTDHAKMAAEIAASLRERLSDLLVKLQAGDYDLTDAKRAELQATVETFSQLDAVRRDAEAVLAHRSTTDPTSSQQSALSLALEIRRRRLRRAGIEV